MLRSDFLDLLIHSTTQTPNVGIAFMGRPLPTMPESFAAPPVGLMVVVQLERLSLEDLDAYFDVLPPDLLLSFTRRARRAICERTSDVSSLQEEFTPSTPWSNPRSVQQLAYRMVEWFNSQADNGEEVRPYFTLEDVDHVMDTVFLNGFSPH